MDGYTASALLINYLHDQFPNWTENYLEWIHHEKKQHGLADLYEDIINKNKYSLIICPDSSSFDGEYHEILYDNGIKVICLDHHPESEEMKESQYAAVINNQLCDYPNKYFSGVGIVWQFCRYLDNFLNTNYSNDYLDLLSIGNTGDMQSLLSIETKHLINKGLKSENIHNPFIYHMWQKNKFKLGDQMTSWGATFYIVPLVNAITRSGTQEEKEVVFNSMIKFKAFEKVPSTKRGHYVGEEETIVDQALRICTNVKNRQTKAVEKAEELVQERITNNNLLDNKVLLLLLNPGEVDSGIAGLLANRLMAKYQRPCCVLTENGDIYQGSARGCDRVGITDFRKICEETGETVFTAGHAGAFGLALQKSSVPAFIQKTNAALIDMSDEPIYYVDYIYNGTNINSQNILDIADMDCYWGKDMEPSLVAVRELEITQDMITIYNKSSITIKITLPNNINLMLFNAKEEDVNKFTNNDTRIIMDCVGEPRKNDWCGNITPQIFITEYDIKRVPWYIF